MAEQITTREKDFSQWYQDVVLKAELADYSPVKGCMVIRPNGYAVWERIQRQMDDRIKETGAKNCYFPMFIPESFLKKEADHVEGFAPQCAVVTYAGSKDLEEKLVVRPTSETIINSMFAKWIQSYRDLPMMVNQWANVVRWEMRTRLFLRTTEFLWQEGHTCHATLDDAEVETQKMLEVYRDFSEQVMAVPVYTGLKTENEKFAGALRTYCIEAMMQDTKALQAGTSHNLSDHFAKAFGTKFLDQDGKQKHVFQTSWGVSTRLIGGLVMTHSDDRGLVLPPALAHTHVMIIPILGKSGNAEVVLKACEDLSKNIQNETSPLPHLFSKISVSVDQDQTKQPGWKFHEHELKGIPLQIQLGPKDLEKNQIVLVRRDTLEKTFIPLSDAPKIISETLGKMQKEMLERAKKFREENTYDMDKLGMSYEDFKKSVDEKGGFYITSWKLDSKNEDFIKQDTKATIRCILLDENKKPIPGSRECFYSKDKNTVRVIFARSY